MYLDQSKCSLRYTLRRMLQHPASLRTRAGLGRCTRSRMCRGSGKDEMDTAVLHGELQTPGTAKEHKRPGTPTINTNDRQKAQLTDQAPGTIEWAAKESHNT